MRGKSLQRALLIACALLLLPGAVHAAPWDVDMYSQQSYKPSEIARSPVKGTVAIGKLPFTLTTEEAATQLTNPVPFSQDSVWSGRRLWNSNCLTCHGDTGAGGPVGPQVGAPDLTTDYYKNRTDGRVFGVMQNGGANMPRYGYKFSTKEQWDIVNYLRFLQGRAVAGIPRPAAQ